MVSMTSQTEVKITYLQIALTEIHNVELEEKGSGLKRDDRRR